MLFSHWLIGQLKELNLVAAKGQGGSPSLTVQGSGPWTPNVGAGQGLWPSVASIYFKGC